MRILNYLGGALMAVAVWTVILYFGGAFESCDPIAVAALEWTCQ